MPIYTAADLLQLTKGQKSILLYGPPFTGKTRSLYTLIHYLKQHNLGPLHLFDFDLKCESLVAKCDKEGLLDYLVVRRLDAPERLSETASRFESDKIPWESFQKSVNSLAGMTDPHTGKWKDSFANHPGAVFCDSLSIYCDIVMQWVLGSLKHELGAPGTHAADDYGRAMSKIMETIRTVKSLPCITGWIAHADLVQSGLDGRILRLPVVTGKKLAPQLAKEFNCTIYCPPPIKDGQNVKYQWQIRGGENGVESAGIAGRDDLPIFVEPDFRKIF